MKKIIVFCLIFVGFVGGAYAINTQFEGFRIAKNNPQEVRVHGDCRKISNHSNNGDAFIPTLSVEEWNSVKNNSFASHLRIEDCQVVSPLPSPPTPTPPPTSPTPPPTSPTPTPPPATFVSRIPSECNSIGFADIGNINIPTSVWDKALWRNKIMNLELIRDGDWRAFDKVTGHKYTCSDIGDQAWVVYVKPGVFPQEITLPSWFAGVMAWHNGTRKDEIWFVDLYDPCNFSFPIWSGPEGWENWSNTGVYDVDPDIGMPESEVKLNDVIKEYNKYVCAWKRLDI